MTLYFCNFPLRLGLIYSCAHRLVLMALLCCGLVALLTPRRTRYLPHTLLYLILPPQVQGGGDVVLDRLRLVLNQLAADRADREYNDHDGSGYPDDDDEDDYDGPLVPPDQAGLLSDDVSFLMLL